MKVLVIGANGNTGYRIVQYLKDSPHMPLAMIRDPKQRERFDQLAVPCVLGDLEYPIDHAVRGCDAVIFAAGSGGKTGKDKTVLVDHIGAIRAAVTALVHDARRFVMLSGLNAVPQAQTGIPHYHRAKAAADQFIREMPGVMEGKELSWTTIHPGGLLDEPNDHQVEISTEIQGQGRTSRDTVAAAMVACLDLPNTVGKRFALRNGTTPLDDALRDL